MSSRAIICGSGLLDSPLFSRGSRGTVSTEYGEVGFLRVGGAFLFQRHGLDVFSPPHAINFRALIAAAADLGAKEIFSFCSVGSLRLSLPPGSLVIPDDVFCPWRRETFFGTRGVYFTIPSVSSALMDVIEELLRARGFDYHRGGTYCQTIGPTFETRAEIRFLQSVGDVVGMTAAQEVFLASELEIPIALLCSCDNYANGVVEETLRFETVEKTAARNRSRLEAIIEDLCAGKP